MARPKLEIDETLVEKMASWGCKTEEIAAHFGCSPDTIQNRFSAVLAKGRADLRTNLRQWQLAAARKGNPALLIWLGKQMLHQKEPESEWKILDQRIEKTEDKEELVKIAQLIIEKSKVAN